MTDAWIDWHSSYVVAGRWDAPPGAAYPLAADAPGTLSCQFEGGFVAVYDGCPLSLWEAFLAADSKGTFHHAHVRHRWGKSYRQGSR